MLTHRRLTVAVAFFAASLSFTASARADSDHMVGVRLGYYADAGKPFVGGELLFRIAPSVYFNPNIEVVFDGDSYLTFNADFHYDFPRRGHTMIWAGAGLGVVAINPSGPVDGHTDAALNVLFGVAAARHPVVPYVQAKLIAKSNTEFSVAFGLRF